MLDFCAEKGIVADIEMIRIQDIEDAYARMQKDVSRVAWSFCKAVRLLMLISCPIYLGMAVTAEPLVETLFGQKWLEMAPFVSILALAMPFMTLQVMFAPVSNALGRPAIFSLNLSIKLVSKIEMLTLSVLALRLL